MILSYGKINQPFGEVMGMESIAKNANCNASLALRFVLPDTPRPFQWPGFELFFSLAHTQYSAYNLRRLKEAQVSDHHGQTASEPPRREAH